jgi:3D (Asp-Asp-Asp) domain-containing protein
MRLMSWNPLRVSPGRRLTDAVARSGPGWWRIVALAFTGWLGVLADSAACEAGVPLAEVLEVRTTAYTHTEASHLKYGTRNAVGGRLRYGKVRSAAADWSRFPLGTRFRIAGSHEVYEIDDYGSALVGKNTIDIYKPTARSMREWGVREVEIEVIEWGAFDKSLEVLLPRMGRAPHIAAMVNGIRARTRKQEDLARSAPCLQQRVGEVALPEIPPPSVNGT